MAILIFYLNLKSEEMPIEEFTQLVGEKNIDAKYNMAKWGGGVWHGVEKPIWVQI